MRMFGKESKPGVSRKQSLASVIVPNEAIPVTRESSGLVSLEVPFAPSTLIEKAARFLGGSTATRRIELDEVGSFVWEMFDGRTTVREMIDRMSQQYKLNRREAEVSLTAFVKTLAGRQLVVVLVPESPD